MIAEIPSSVLVTITDIANNYKSDFELPSQMLIKDLTMGILRLLREFEPKKYAGRTSVDLWVGEKKLKDDQTLASAGVWDGSEITLHFPGKRI